MYFKAIRKYFASVFHEDLEQSRLGSRAHRSQGLAIDQQVDALSARAKRPYDDTARRQMSPEYRMRIAMTQSEQTRQLAFRDF